MHSTIDYRNLHFKLSGCIPCRILVYYVCMKTATHLYVSRKNVLTWLMALCMVASAVARIAFPGLKGSGDSLQLWSQIILPIAATTLYALITLFSGEEFFYKTAIPVWMMVIYSGLWIAANVESRMMVWLFWIALIFFAYLYQNITSGRQHTIFLLLPVILAMAAVKYLSGAELQAQYLAMLSFLPFFAYADQYLQLVLRVKRKNALFARTNMLYTATYVGGNIALTLIWGVPGLIVSQYVAHVAATLHSAWVLREEDFFRPVLTWGERTDGTICPTP